MTSASAHPAKANTAKSSKAHSNKGSLRLCTAASKAKSSKFTIKGHGHTYTRTLHPSASHSVCRSVKLRHGSYRITQSMRSGERVANIKISPSYAAYTRSTAHASARVSVRKHKTTRVTYYDLAAKKATPAPVTSPTPTPTPGDPGTGFLEVCKYVLPGDPWISHTGEVTVSITSGSFSDSEVIPVGQCTDPIQVPAGAVSIQETKIAAPDYLAKVITNPSSALVSLNSNTNTAVVTVAASSDESVETTAALFNATATGYVKICKTLGPNASELLGGTFTFTTSYQLAGSTSWTPWDTVSVTVPADGSLGTAYCTLDFHRLPVGTVVQASEVAHSGSHVIGVTVRPASQDAGSTATTAMMMIGPNNAGTTTATFTDMADGTIEICKNVTDPIYNGMVFTFMVNGKTYSVRAGDCSAPITVPAGTATVSETADPDFVLVGMTATGPDGQNRIVSGTNPITVSVPAGGAGNETLVTATNRVKTSQVKICKIVNYKVQMGPNPQPGDPFVSYNFHASFSSNGAAYDVTLTPESVGPNGEVCSSLSPALPVITDAARDRITLTVTEGASPWGQGQITVEPDVITYDGNGGDVVVNEWSPTNADNDGHYGLSATLGNGINIVTFTNDLVDPNTKN